MEKNALVTVIMPSLNVADYIEKCLKSVIEQTWKKLEILCIDAGSTDGTLEILHSFALQDSRIKVVNSPVKSYGYQVNLGIEQASGEYIEIIETDDFIEVDMIERLVQIAELNELDLVKCNACKFIEFDGRIIGTELRCLSNDNLYGKVLNSDENITIQTMDCNIWNGIYRKSFLDKFNIRCNETFGAAYQDIGFLIRSLNCASSGYYINEPLYNYRTDRDESSSYSPKCLINAYKEYQSLLEGFYLDGHGNNEKRWGIVDLEKTHSLYVKIAKSFVWEFGKAISLTQYNIDSEYIREPLEWFRDILRKSIDDGIISRKDFDEQMWMNIRFLIDNPVAYKEYCRIRDDISDDKKNTVREQIGDNTIVIVGSGQRGKRTYDTLFYFGIDVVLIADNDSAKWSSRSRFSPEITSPEDAVKRYPNAMFIVANKMHANDLRKQLMDVGVSNSCILNDDNLIE